MKHPVVDEGGADVRVPRFSMLRVVIAMAALYYLLTGFLMMFVWVKSYPISPPPANPAAAAAAAVTRIPPPGPHAVTLPSFFTFTVALPEKAGPLVRLFRIAAIVAAAYLILLHLPLKLYFLRLRRRRSAPEALGRTAEELALRSPLMTALMIFIAASADVVSRTLSLLGGQGAMHGVALRSIPFYAVVALLISFFAYYWQSHRMRMVFSPFIFTRTGFIQSSPRPRRKTIGAQLGMSKVITALLPLTLVILYLVAFASTVDVRSLSQEGKDLLFGTYRPLYGLLESSGELPATGPLSMPYLSVVDTLLFAGGVASAFVVSLIMLFLISRWSTHSIVDPIRELQRNVMLTARGDFTHVTPVRDTDEIGELTEDFNSMLASLRASESLRVEKEAAETANQAKSSFLANMSHELRTPLNAIIGFAQLMERGENLDAEQRESLATITRSGNHLLSLINDILDMSKIEAGRAELNPAAFDLREMLQTLEGMFTLRAREKRLTLIFDVAPQVPRYLVTDEGKLRQIIVNLLGNAIKFTAAGGATLRLTCRPEAGGDVRLAGEVEDTGVGISPEEMDGIFQPFTQTRRGGSQEGTGLGLSISRRYAELLGGSLSAKSQPGKGSVFSFEVRAGVADAGDVAPARPRRKVTGLAPGQQVFRMIVAEDRDSNRDLLIRILEPLGFSVKGVRNGAECVSLWESWEPHLIWMDIRMPVMDGTEATRRIKSSPRGRETLIIALTASAFDSDRREILAGGCDDFVRKPFVEEEIFQKLEEHLGVRFTFAEEAPVQAGAGAAPAARELDPAALAGTPQAWRDELARATVQADYERLLALAAEIRGTRPGAADSLTALVNAFEYEKILAALDLKG
jgi:signal transduction histidine kinase